MAHGLPSWSTRRRRARLRDASSARSGSTRSSTSTPVVGSLIAGDRPRMPIDGHQQGERRSWSTVRCRAGAKTRRQRRVRVGLPFR